MLEKEEAEKRKTVSEEAKKVKIIQDLTLPNAVRIHLKDPRLKRLRSGDRKKDVDYSDGRGSRVRVCGRVHRLRV